MRKRLITPSPQDAAAHDEGWLDLDRLAVVEVTSIMLGAKDQPGTRPPVRCDDSDGP
jgi:hypothetical protein